jgi:Flp pilus assembly protein TadD
MNRLACHVFVAIVAVLAAAAASGQSAAARSAPAAITVDYPADASLFPPEFPPPLFLWRDPAANATAWVIEVALADGTPALRLKTQGERMRIGEVDPRCVAANNEPPRLTREETAAHTWRPDGATWAAIKQHSVRGVAMITIRGYATGNPSQLLSRGAVRIRTSTDPVGAPIFYRDVPLVPSQTEKGVIKPLAQGKLPLIAWRLRDVGETRSRVLMQGLHTCANCHSSSRDGKFLALDVDGPQNDKGLYAVVPIRPETSIRSENVIAWSTFRGKLGGKLRVGFMSQISPDGDYVVTTINDPGLAESEYQRRKNLKEVALNYYVANFKDYRFLQVFYPTRGILAWYSRATGQLRPLPGADDPRYVQTNVVWSPDGKYLVFARAKAQDPYPPGATLAQRANDPNETQMHYDLYRIPFNGGEGGAPEAIAGASHNGMSNSFPKVSPDGRWIVYVQARNGLLMRPDGKLYIVPVGGGPARRMRCNTRLMNSWHSFSPNGRWLVFSSKSLSPYTQMFLTHIDENGEDSPALLIENATAANRAVNIPEFLNIPSGGLLRMDAPVTDYYRVVDTASELLKKGEYEAAAAEWRKAVELGPTEALAHSNLGVALAETGRSEEAIREYGRALELSPDYPEAHNNLGEALIRTGKFDEAIPHFRRAVELLEAMQRLRRSAELSQRLANAHSNLGATLAHQGSVEEAVPHLLRAVEHDPKALDLRNNLGIALASLGRFDESISQLEQAVKLTGGKNARELDLLGRVYAEAGRFAEAAQAARQGLSMAAGQQNQALVEALKARIGSYESRMRSQTAAPPR